MKKKSECAGCAYWRVLGTSQGPKLWACHYLIDTGKSRGCEPGVGCVRKAARISRRRRYTQHGIEEVVAHDNERMAFACRRNREQHCVAGKRSCKSMDTSDERNGDY